MKLRNAKQINTTVLTNPLNSEQWLCDDVMKIKEIDGVPYITVYKPENKSRTFLMRKDVFKIKNL